jgi:hypothetical protein
MFISFIPDPNFFHPGSTSKNLIILTPKSCFKALGNMIRVVHPGSRGAKEHRIPDPQHWSEEAGIEPRLL